MVDQYEFLECSSVNINYQQNGLATLSFTVVSTESVPGVNPPRDFTQLSFGGITYTGYITQLDSTPIPASIPTVWEHKYAMTAIGCADDCPRGATRPS